MHLLVGMDIDFFQCFILLGVDRTVKYWFRHTEGRTSNGPSLASKTAGPHTVLPTKPTPLHAKKTEIHCNIFIGIWSKSARPSLS